MGRGCSPYPLAQGAEARCLAKLTPCSCCIHHTTVRTPWPEAVTSSPRPGPKLAHTRLETARGAGIAVLALLAGQGCNCTAQPARLPPILCVVCMHGHGRWASRTTQAEMHDFSAGVASPRPRLQPSMPAWVWGRWSGWEGWQSLFLPEMSVF